MNSESPHPISGENSRKIVNLSFFCMLLVCIVHVQWRETTEIERTLFVANLVVGAFSAIGMIPAQSRVGGLVYYTFSVLGLLYFLAGACLARHPITLSRRAGNICGVVSLVVIAIQMTIFCLGVVIPFDFRVFLLPTLLAFLWTRTPTTRLPRVLVQAIFPIYLMHVIIYDALENLVFSPETFGGFAMLFSGVGFSIVLSALLHRFLPRLAHLVFGGR